MLFVPPLAITLTVKLLFVAFVTVTLETLGFTYVVVALVVLSLDLFPLVSTTYTLKLYVVPAESPLNLYVLLVELT